MTRLLAIGLISIFLTGCLHKRTEPVNEVIIHPLQDALSRAIIFDGFSPPVASRIYAYSSIAAYECIRLNDTAMYPELSDKLTGFSLRLKTERDVKYNYRVAMVSAFCKVSSELVYRGFFIDSARNNSLMLLNEECDNATMQRSQQLGEDVAGQVLAWAAKDNYKETRNMPRYTPINVEGHWAPTAPTYNDALEPYWKLIRPFTLDSASQYQLPGPPAFSVKKEAALYKEAAEVMDYVIKADSFWVGTVEYWDCNPQRTYLKGHIMYTQRKLTPAGHWMYITKEACEKKQLNDLEAARVYCLVSISLADAFLAAWEEKYRIDFIRPETYINRYINKNWKPVIETPTFPEYPSAHSTISASAATMLTSIFGDNFSFVDSTEIKFKMQPRTFHSFFEAADQAAISRAYAGIHFMRACEDGKKLGRMIGEHVVNKLAGKQDNVGGKKTSADN